uniref:Protein phosphatase n=1 Tax=Chromera velia CCMP2878 TaxID=1169474 RepID=A0A0G4HVX1_9ALVE|eukprot:Cvel_8952.t1-p1 / transcript=Cvel_8952.t1 / gene=Cvel_8952 / organism=Chromera_velia_CCMP2878 / gene_product=Protein phosphatase PTC7 homolog fig, putative / transcript_product=Protein phosphatase PTC7 homolog fig, putative / location=Cvel_scaffold504:63019-66679(-) / protein_length=728 / sequence_SO=supercontig / SO=protein_coding / is_pseudo=false
MSSKSSELCFVVGGTSKTHPHKLPARQLLEGIECNEDAWVGSWKGVCVSDGVGSMRQLYGVDPSLLPKELALRCMEKIHEPDTDPRNLPIILWESACDCESRGAATCVLVAIQGDTLYACNLGDSGWKVLRKGNRGEYRTIFASRESCIQFNMPYQVMTASRAQGPAAAAGPEAREQQVRWEQTLRVHIDARADKQACVLAHGDILLAHTDGVDDNLSGAQLEAAVNRAVKTAEAKGATWRRNEAGGDPQMPSLSPEALSRELWSEAWKWGCNRPFDPHADSKNDTSLMTPGWPSRVDWRTSFSHELEQSTGRVLMGGKPDDITVVAAFVAPVDSAAANNSQRGVAARNGSLLPTAGEGGGAAGSGNGSAGASPKRTETSKSGGELLTSCLMKETLQEQAFKGGWVGNCIPAEGESINTGEPHGHSPGVEQGRAASRGRFIDSGRTSFTLPEDACFTGEEEEENFELEKKMAERTKLNVSVPLPSQGSTGKGDRMGVHAVHSNIQQGRVMGDRGASPVCDETIDSVRSRGGTTTGRENRFPSLSSETAENRGSASPPSLKVQKASGGGVSPVGHSASRDSRGSGGSFGRIRMEAVKTPKVKGDDRILSPAHGSPVSSEGRDYTPSRGLVVQDIFASSSSAATTGRPAQQPSTSASSTRVPPLLQGEISPFDSADASPAATQTAPQGLLTRGASGSGGERGGGGKMGEEMYGRGDGSRKSHAASPARRG